MDKSAGVFWSALGVFLLVILCVGLLGELVMAFIKLEQVSPQKSKEQWQLEARLSWKCFVANYAWQLRFPWAVKMSRKAAAELEEWTQGEAAEVVSGWNPGSPSRKRFRLYNRFDLSS